jgi:hypothetical protein
MISFSMCASRLPDWNKLSLVRGNTYPHSFQVWLDGLHIDVDFTSDLTTVSLFKLQVLFPDPYHNAQ